MMAPSVGKDTLIASFLLCLFTFGVAYARDAAPSGNSVQRPDHSSVPSGPVLRVPETVFDFGLAIGEDEVVHEFPVFNAGTDTLKIEEVIAG
jgi:hypothetical protein